MQLPIKPFTAPLPRIHDNIREAIVYALRQIFTENRYSDHVLERLLKSNPRWGSRDRKMIAESVFDITRHWRLLLESLRAYPDPEPSLFVDVVDFYFFLKGCDRPDVREQNQAAIARLQKLLAARVSRQSVPDWLDAFGVEQLGETKWNEELAALNSAAEVFLRVNTLKITREKLQAALRKEEIETETVNGLPDALQLASRKNIFQSQAFKSGLFEIQDAASQLVAPLLDPKPGMRVIDACAGGGGKTLHLAALMQNKGRIIALDTIAPKLTELTRRARRNSVSTVETRLIDSGKVIKRLAASADRVLIDAPCSGSGVIRRNPDTKWKLSPEMMNRLTALQADILKSYALMTKPGGFLVYATCSIFPVENNLQVEKFISGDPRFALREEKKILTSETGMDGFYMAKIERLG